MPNLNIFVGNIGSGKSLLATKFAKMGNVVCSMDSIQRMIGGGEYGLYDNEKKDVYQAAEDAIITKSLERGLSVVIDRTNMDRKRRQRFIEIGKRFGADIVAYHWGPGDERCLQRRIAQPYGMPAEKWVEVFAFMQKSYEPPTLEEGLSQIIEAPKKYTFHAFDFDGTIVENKFPEIGEIISGKVDVMNRLWKDLSNIIIVWTCREGNFEAKMRDFLNSNKIPHDFINANPIFDTGSRKIYAHVYHDDRNADTEYPMESRKRRNP
jgi:predicted kinase